MTRTAGRWAAHGLLMAVVLAPSWAAGDVIPEDVDACREHEIGAVCGGTRYVPAGRCRQSTCSHVNYQAWDHESGRPPPSSDSPCVRCVSEPSSTANCGRGCSVVSSRDGRSVGPWLLAALVGAAFLARPRREP